jgi:hypothetical protein
LVKTLFVLFAFLFSSNNAPVQGPLSRDEALAQMYKNYDPAKQQANWACDQKSADLGQREGWPCNEGEVVAVSVLLTSQVKEGDEWKTYIVTSASPHQYECHQCAPSVGVGIFAWKEGRWQLASANVAVGFYGEYGGPPLSELIAIGADKHGVILWSGGSNQGYHGSMKYLLAPVGDSVSEVWQLNDETDNSGAFDLTDNFAPHRQYYAEAAFKFVWDGKDDIYEIIVMSRGSDAKGPANWTAVYRFRDGKYQLLRKTPYTGLPHSTSRAKTKQ